MAVTGWAALLRFCAMGLFIVSAIIYWGAWTATTASGLLAAGLACLAASMLPVPERYAPSTRTRGAATDDELYADMSPRADRTTRERVGRR